jgi:hypothetical protein
VTQAGYDKRRDERCLTPEYVHPAVDAALAFALDSVERGSEDWVLANLGASHDAALALALALATT